MTTHTHRTRTASKIECEQNKAKKNKHFIENTIEHSLYYFWQNNNIERYHEILANEPKYVNGNVYNRMISSL